MTEKRNITKEDVLLKARLLSEGVRLEAKETLQWGKATQDEVSGVPTIVFDDCDVVSKIRVNPRSCLEVLFEGNDVTILDMGEVLGTATLRERAPWRDIAMSDGATVNNAIAYDGGFVAMIVVANRCHTYDSGKGCKFCGFAHTFAQTGPVLSAEDTIRIGRRQIDALAIAIQNGWRGTVLLVGGATAPERRGKWTTDLFEAHMEYLHKSVDNDVLSQLQIASDVYPPDDLEDLYKWKRFGINSCQFDSQVMDPAYFRAICPGRGDQKRWHEVQEAAAEVFGRGRGSSSLLVTGIEPMARMMEGIEERVSKGVYIQPTTFAPFPNSPMAGMNPPSAEWYVEAAERIVDIYFRYADTFDVDLTEDDRWGYTRRGNSYESIADDEKSRRLQEMGKLPPGLPKQDGIEMPKTSL